MAGTAGRQPKEVTQRATPFLSLRIDRPPAATGYRNPSIGIHRRAAEEDQVKRFSACSAVSALEPEGTGNT